MSQYVDAMHIEMATYLPFVKLSKGRYLIGTHARQVELKQSGQLVVRIGGGFEYLDDYLKKHSRAECLQLNMLKNRGDGTAKNAIIRLLQSKQVDKKIVDKYAKRYDQAFEK